ncbi:dipeptide epimerase [Pseudoxanthomonas broegbernensis]|uniref:Dipeptide epimerase n=1 Tax=Pseudoxanthomonas broegbernensis TaxID=83619 RepID=A0A7V8K879_9GAMM|nr:dipeptide epimerase [Pseudoxanthomonas broegbernensis]KAF1687371.1 dipeptide epimerase [Pseudoxanthomonas broegbernensis]MBB6065624.1 L-alanine-DL-glutamate epimerase-like enolase superfamily enzyme [Pseudoxanthomonas broegbernensis]
MRIAAIELGMLRVPLKTPFRTALRTVEAIEDVVVLLRTDDGRTGHGSAPATAAITGDTHASIVEAIAGHIGPRLIGRPVDELNRNCALVQGALAGNPSAKAAVDIALHDAWAQLHGAPLYRLLGGGEPVLRTDTTLGLDTVEAMVARAVAAVEQGYDALKIKVGRDTGTDLERVRAIHAAVGGRARLRLDANQGWSARQAVRTMRTLEDAGILPELLEQPVAAADIDGLAHVSAHIHTPVMADESVFGPAQAVELIRRRAADIVNIKLMKAGGIHQAARIVDIAAVHGVRCMIGCMVESAIGAGAAAHLAVSRADTLVQADLDGPSLARANPVAGGVAFDGPRIVLADAPGLGIEAIDGLQPLPR